MKVSLALIKLLLKMERWSEMFTLPALSRTLAHMLAEVVKEVAILAAVFAPFEHIAVWKVLAIIKIAPWIFLAGFLFEVFAGQDTSRKHVWVVFLLGLLLTLYGIPNLFWVLLA